MFEVYLWFCVFKEEENEFVHFPLKVNVILTFSVPYISKIYAIIFLALQIIEKG